jgi:GntR family transcriptional regulator
MACQGLLVLIQIDKHSGVPVYRQVMEQVTRQIMSGSLVEGDQLESVANLAKRINVNPMTISKAYGFLVEEQLIERRAGVGLFVRSVRKDKKRKVRDSLLDEAMNKAAALTVQLGIDADEARALFDEYYQLNKASRENAA